MLHPSRARSTFLRGVAVAAALMAGGGSCASRPPAGDLDPRYVAVHNALAASGLAQVGPLRRGKLLEGHEERLPIELGAGCTTVVAIGGPGVQELEATLLDPGGKVVAREAAHAPESAVRACVDSAGSSALVVRMASGSGDFLVGTWATPPGVPPQGGPAAAGGPAAPAGTCEAPLRLTAGELSGTTTRGESENQGTCANSAARELVYRLDLPARQSVTIEVNTQRFDSVLYVRKGDCTDEGAEVACNDDAPNQHRSKIEGVFDPGTYYVFVDGYGSDGGPFQLKVNLLDIPPLAEVCGKAERLASGVKQLGDTAGTFDEVNASCGEGAHGPDTPYQLVAPVRERVRIKMQAESFTPVVHVRRRCAEEASEIACAASGAGDHDATFVGYLDPGAYTVFADAAEPEAEGTFTLLTELAPEHGSGAAGDGCADALPLPKGEPLVRGDTFMAKDDTSGKCGGTGAADVIYRVELARRSRFTAHFTSEEAEHVFLLSKHCADRATELACGAQIDETLAAGTYFLAVDGEAPDAFGAYAFEWSARDLVAQENGCKSAPVLSDGQSVTATTAGAANKFSPGCAGGGGAGDRAYRIVLAARSRVRLVLASSGFVGVLSLRSSCEDGGAKPAELGCSAESDDTHHTHIETTLDAGSYTVIVDGKARDGAGPGEGTFTLDYHVVH